MIIEISSQIETLDPLVVVDRVHCQQQPAFLSPLRFRIRTTHTVPLRSRLSSRVQMLRRRPERSIPVTSLTPPLTPRHNETLQQAAIIAYQRARAPSVRPLRPRRQTEKRRAPPRISPPHAAESRRSNPTRVTRPPLKSQRSPARTARL
ncbi:unnamed protein product [Dicrocoelium dendriticum]|nr:unnamed protein product [Dicrocoelium dendriticum]